nr:zinc finger protein 346 isoform X3 [Microcebus murinus]
MEYSALGTVETADDRGAGPRHSSEEREGREPDGVRFDRERARSLWEAVSGAQPVGREEVEHMIEKNQCLFTNTQCKVCCALLISESQKLAHYQSKKHANKVKRYLAIHGMETLKGETKKLDSDQKSSRSKDKNQCCPICNMTFSSPVVAQSHYLGKTHAKNLKLKQQSTKVEALSKRLTNPFLVASTLALHQNREMIDPDKFCSLCHATFNDPVMAQQHYVGKKHRKQETKLKLMARYGRLADSAVTDFSGHQKQRHRPWARFQCKGNPFRKSQPPWKTRDVSTQHPLFDQPRTSFLRLMIPQYQGAGWYPRERNGELIQVSTLRKQMFPRPQTQSSLIQLRLTAWDFTGSGFFLVVSSKNSRECHHQRLLFIGSKKPLAALMASFPYSPSPHLAMPLRIVCVRACVCLCSVSWSLKHPNKEFLPRASLQLNRPGAVLPLDLVRLS